MKALITTFDMALTRAIQAMPAWLGGSMSAISFLGLPVVIILFAGVAMIVSFRMNQTRFVFALGSVLAGLSVNSVLKLFLHRTRPDTLYVGAMKIRSFSFPSGHAYGAAALYGLLAYIAWHTLPSPWNGIVAGLLILLVVMIGLSRVYLGAHFPTDVLGGWLLGGLTVALIVAWVRPLG